MNAAQVKRKAICHKYFLQIAFFLSRVSNYLAVLWKIMKYSFISLFFLLCSFLSCLSHLFQYFSEIPSCFGAFALAMASGAIQQESTRKKHVTGGYQLLEGKELVSPSFTCDHYHVLNICLMPVINLEGIVPILIGVLIETIYNKKLSVLIQLNSVHAGEQNLAINVGYIYICGQPL